MYEVLHSLYCFYSDFFLICFHFDLADDLYSALAAATGGSVHHATDSDIADISNVVIADAAASEVSVLRWNDDDFTNVSLKVPYDDTTKKVSVKVSGHGPSGKTRLFNPSGNLFLKLFVAYYVFSFQYKSRTFNYPGVLV